MAERSPSIPPRCVKCPLPKLDGVAYRRNCKGPLSTEVNIPYISELKTTELNDGATVAVDESDDSTTYVCEVSPFGWDPEEGRFNTVLVLGAIACRNPAVKAYIEGVI